MRSHVTTTVLLLGLLSTGCASTAPVDVEGAATFAQLREEVARSPEPLAAPVRPVDVAGEPATLAYRWVVGARSVVENRTSLSLSMRSTTAVDDGDPASTDLISKQIGAEQVFELVVESSGPAGARLRGTITNIRLSRDDMSDRLDTLAGTTMGEPTIDAWGRCVGVPFAVDVDARGEVTALDGRALRAGFLAGQHDPETREKLVKEVEARLTDRALMADLQELLPMLPGGLVQPGQRWTRETAGRDPTGKGSRVLVEEFIYLGTTTVGDVPCAALYSRRFLSGRDEVDEDGGITVASPVISLHAMRVRLDDGQLMASRPEGPMRAVALVAVSSEIMDKDVRISISTEVEATTHLERLP